MKRESSFTFLTIKKAYLFVIFSNIILSPAFFIHEFLFFKKPDNLFYYGGPLILLLFWFAYALYRIMIAPERLKLARFRLRAWNLFFIGTTCAALVILILTDRHQTLEKITDFHGQPMGHPRYQYSDPVTFLLATVLFLGELVGIDTALMYMRKERKELGLNIISLFLFAGFVLVYWFNIPSGYFKG